MVPNAGLLRKIRLIEQRYSTNCKKAREYVYLINTDKEINSVRVTCNQRVINEQIFRLMVAKLVCNTQKQNID